MEENKKAADANKAVQAGGKTNVEVIVRFTDDNGNTISQGVSTAKVPGPDELCIWDREGFLDTHERLEEGLFAASDAALKDAVEGIYKKTGDSKKKK